MFITIPKEMEELRSLVSISEVREWVTKPLQEPPSSGDALTRVLRCLASEVSRSTSLGSE